MKRQDLSEIVASSGGGKRHKPPHGTSSHHKPDTPQAAQATKMTISPRSR